uniref:Uncharacterized protein n=1 Tax=Nelumbo nucifera TaxID=4432 RepID=A0A822YDZ6_NELNU|nr:TPA_asm: hypothetical protein HUJ06_031199 [Nelumbo nucifera]
MEISSSSISTCAIFVYLLILCLPPFQINVYPD